MQGLHLEVNPASVKRQGNLMHGIAGEWNGLPVLFMYDASAQDIIIPESLEPIYPAIEAAVLRFLREM